MAPKKRKAAVETVDLAEAEDSGDDYVPTPKQPKRRRAASGAAGGDDAPKKGGRKKASAAAQEEAGGSGAAATSAAAAAVVAAAAAAAGGAGVFGSQPAAAGGRKAPKSKKQSARDDARLDARVDAAGRAVSFRPTANQDVRDRIARAMPGSAHRMFLVESRQVAAADAPGGPEQEFHVLGATGNVYVVHIGTQPACTCPDFAKRAGLCKHILFVMLRVLRQDRLDPVIWQRALTIREAQRVLSVFNGGGAGGAGVVDQSVLANERLRKRYADIVHGGAAGGESAGEEAGGAAGKKGVQRPVEGDCPICCEEMHAGGPAKEAVTFCGLCGNNMHKECFGRWAASKRSNRQPVTCVYCRADWQEGGGGGAAGGGAAAAGGGTPGGADGQYVNLSQFSDDHRRGASLTDLYGTGAYFMMANAGQMSRREAARMYAADRGWE